MTDPYLSGSIWFHSIVIGGLIGSHFKVTRPTRDFRTTLATFLVFVAWAGFSVLILKKILDNAITSYFMSAFPDSLNVANVLLGLAELCFYHRYGKLTPLMGS